MKEQSPSFSPFALVRNVGCNIEFQLIDVGAKEEASETVSGNARASQSAQVLNDIKKASGKWATLEDDLWVLDGSMDILPEDVTPYETGWWSDALSDGTGVFEKPPYVLFDFAGNSVSTIGYTLFFDDKIKQFPIQIRVTTYGSDGSTIIAQKTFQTSGIQQILDFPSENYYSVKFEFLRTADPYRRIKMLDIIFGIIQIFDNSSLSDVSFEYGADIMAESIPSRELVFTFDNSDRKYNLLNPSGIYAFLQDGQQIKSTIEINGESVDMGTFFYTSAKAKDSALTAEITANDLILTLENQIYTGGANITKTLVNAVSDILNGTNLQMNLSPEASETNVVMAIPEDTSKREALRLVVQAAMCTAWIDRDNVLQIRKLAVNEAEDVLSADRLYDFDGISVSEKVDSVTLTVKNEYSDSETVYTAGSGKNILSRKNPCVAPENGDTVAAWMLACYERRKKYDVKNRCNPAVEIGDTVQIYDAYGQNENASVTGISISFNGALSANTKAVGA